jgi:hypothetical protein
MNGRQRPRAANAPLPLLIGFGLFVATLVYLVAVSLTRRDAPVFSPSSVLRTRPADWMRGGDTLTLDATDGDHWRFVSLTEGRSLTGADTARWQLAARRYRVTVAGALADLGRVPFEHAGVSTSTRFLSSRAGEIENEAIRHWYRYSLMTHLLTPDGRVYALRDRDGRLWKLEVVGYYCPRLIAGCLTLRYAPL